MPKKSYTLAYFREMVIFGVTPPGGKATKATRVSLVSLGVDTEKTPKKVKK